MCESFYLAYQDFSFNTMSLRVNVRKALIAIPVSADTAYFHVDRRTRLSRKSPKTASGMRKAIKPQQTTGKVFKLYFDFNVFSAENRRLFSIEFQLHTNSHITLWLPVEERDQELQRYDVLFSQVKNINTLRNGEVK